MRPTDLLEKLEYLDDRLLVVHITYVMDEGAERVAKPGVAFVFYYSSLYIIDGELPKGRRFSVCGGRVGFGTDQASGDNYNIMLNEMKVAPLLHRSKNESPTAMST